MMRGHTDTGARSGSGSGPDRRGQAFTLEAIAAAIVVLGSLLFALQVSGVTSLSQSTSNRQVVEQQGAVAAGALDRAAANGSLRPALLYWDDSTEAFHAPNRTITERDENYYTGPPPGELAFARTLNGTLGDRNVAYNVDLLYRGADGVERQPLVRFGQPSDDAARATRTVTLYDDDRLRYPNGTRTNTTLANASSSFYAPDGHPDDPIYSVVRVEVVVWRV